MVVASCQGASKKVVRGYLRGTSRIALTYRIVKHELIGQVRILVSQLHHVAASGDLLRCGWETRLRPTTGSIRSVGCAKGASTGRSAARSPKGCGQATLCTCRRNLPKQLRQFMLEIRKLRTLIR